MDWFVSYWLSIPLSEYKRRRTKKRKEEQRLRKQVTQLREKRKLNWVKDTKKNPRKDKPDRIGLLSVSDDNDIINHQQEQLGKKDNIEWK